MTPEAVVDIGTLLESTPGIAGGRLHLKGSRLTVHNIAARYLRGMTAEDMAADRPDLDPSLFHAALAYYYANRARIDAEMEADTQFAEDLMRRFPNGIGPEEARLLASEE